MEKATGDFGRTHTGESSAMGKLDLRKKSSWGGEPKERYEVRGKSDKPRTDGKDVCDGVHIELMGTVVEAVEELNLKVKEW